MIKRKCAIKGCENQATHGVLVRSMQGIIEICQEHYDKAKACGDIA